MKSKREIEISHQIDGVCDKFEEAWLKNALPRIEDFCEAVPSGYRSRLIVELVELDVAYRQKHGMSLDLNGYAIAFPEALPELRPYLLSLMAQTGSTSVESTDQD